MLSFGCSSGFPHPAVTPDPLLHAHRHQDTVFRDRQRNRLTEWRERHGFAWIRVYRVLAVGGVPFSHARVLVHLLHDVPPADAGIVGAERDFAHLRPVRNDAHLRPAEVVGPEILEPHPGHEQHEPLVGLAIAVRRRAHSAQRSATLFVELLDQVDQPEALWRTRRPVVPQHAQGGLDLGDQRARAPNPQSWRASSKKRSTLNTSASGAHSFVRLLTSSAVPVPQLG